jgi:hypothetical protein
MTQSLIPPFWRHTDCKIRSVISGKLVSVLTKLCVAAGRRKCLCLLVSEDRLPKVTEARCESIRKSNTVLLVLGNKCYSAFNWLWLSLPWYVGSA